MAAIRERTRIFTAPRLLMSSIFNCVYSLPPSSRMERISSPVMASVPQPKLTSCTSSMSGCWQTYRAALYIRAWKVHWLSTFRGAYSS